MTKGWTAADAESRNRLSGRKVGLVVGKALRDSEVISTRPNVEMAWVFGVWD